MIDWPRTVDRPHITGDLRRSRRTTPLAALILLVAAASLLQGQFYFGRNKIQYDQFDWQVLTTPHFQIFYYQAEERLARAAAFWAEEAFDDLEQKFNHTLNRRIPLVIYSNHLHFQQTNTIPQLLPEGIGGFFEFIKGRVVLPNNGSMHDFRHVIRHELVHVFMHAKTAYEGGKTGAWDQPGFPLWFTEGLAEWWSEGWDAEAEMIIRDALLNDHLLPLSSLSLAGAGYLLYKEGQSFLRYLEQTYGADRIRQVMVEHAHHKSIEKTLAAVTGDPYPKIAREWRLSLKQAAAVTLAKQTMPGHKNRILTRLGANVSPAIYQDATGKSHVVYLSSRDGHTSIYRQNLETSEVQLVIKGERSPETESLHFLQSGLAINGAGLLAFVAKSYERDVVRLVDLETFDQVAEFSHPSLVTIRSPGWSQRGDHIVFSAQDRAGQTDLYLWEVAASEALRLTDDIYLDRDPSFSPDGRTIVFSSDRDRPELDGGTNLFLLDLDSRQIRVLTSGPNEDRRPRWSLDDPHQILFVSDRSGTPNIWRVGLPDEAPAKDPSMALSPLTDLHTGAVDFLPMAGDSLLLTTFSGYSFQLHLASADSLTTFQPTGPRARPVPRGSWTQPRYSGGTATESRPYRLKYSLDIAQTAVAFDPIFGLLGGFQLGLSDILGNRYYHFLIANTAQKSSEFVDRFNLAITTVNLTRRVNHSFGIFRFANIYYDPYQQFYFERTLGVRAAMNYPLSVFRRVELSGSLWKSQKSFFGPEGRRDAFLLSNYFSWVHDNSLWHPVGPVDGWRIRITVGQTYNFQIAQVHNYTALVDNRYYYRVTRNVTLAQRTLLWYNEGTDVRPYYIGGSWGMRGYQWREIFGRKVLMLNQEIRFPFAQSLALRSGSFALWIGPIRGALFLDVGNAWDAEFPGFRGSYGVGLRGLFLGGLVLRLDRGRRTDFHSVDRPHLVDHRRFTQFFFGWDF